VEREGAWLDIGMSREEQNKGEDEEKMGFTVSIIPERLLEIS